MFPDDEFSTTTVAAAPVTTQPPAEPDPTDDSSTTVPEPIDTTPVPNREAILATALTWEDATSNLVGLESTCGNVSYLTAHPDKDEFFVGIGNQGVFRLVEETGEWEPLGTQSGSDPIVNRMSWIEFDAQDPDRFWQAGTYGNGVFRTEDGGRSFDRLGDIRHVDYVSVDAADPERSTMLAGGHEDRVVYLSTDGGDTWDDIAGTLPANVGFTAYPIVRDPTTFVLGTRRDSNAGIFRTEDGGATWETVAEGAINGPPLIDGDTIYWLADQGGGLLVSKDGGESFVQQRGSIGGRPATLDQLQDGRLLTHNERALLISDNEGESWFPAGPPLPFVPSGVAATSDGSAIYAWTLTCNFGDGGNPIVPGLIIRLDLAPESDEQG